MKIISEIDLELFDLLESTINKTLKNWCIVKTKYWYEEIKDNLDH